MSGSAGAMSDVSRSRDVTVVELLDRLLDKGVVLAGDLTISVAGVDLVELSLRVLLCSTEAAERAGAPTPSETDALSRDALASRALDSDAFGSDAFGSDALGSDALGSDALGSDALAPRARGPQIGEPGGGIEEEPED